MEKYNFLVGKSLNEAKSFAESAGLTTRIVNMDNVPFVITCDYRMDRLNLTLENGIITEIGIG